jgi:hypothetical protein
MRYFDIVKPSGRHTLGNANAIEAAPVDSGTRKSFKHRPALVSNWLNQINRRPQVTPSYMAKMLLRLSNSQMATT